MLVELPAHVPHTSWFWLRNGANQILEPFDRRIYIQQGQQLVPTNNFYQLVDGDRALLNGFHTTHLAQAIAALPHNNHIEDNAVEFGNHDNINVPEAVMNELGISQPVVQVGANATVKTYGAGPCLPMLVRATAAANNTHGVGIVHLSANDMQSLPFARNGILRVCNALRVQLADLAATCHCYLAGGSIAPEMDDDVLDEYARTVAALQMAAANAANHMVFDGALVPAVDQDGDYIDVLIDANNIYYQEDNINGSDSGGEDSSS
jgi:hypothetical protein